MATRSADGGGAATDAEDLRYLRRALRLAARGRFTVAPNPQVGAVVVRDGQVLGEGFHRRAGEAHAEAAALAGLPAGGARGATLYVNLEPCNHQGRTPPCVDRVLEAGVARVVYCHRDPNPLAARGRERLETEGVEVRSGLLVEEAVALNLRFLAPLLLGRPAVTLKWAMSLDGRIATATGESQWISSAAGRRWALELREEHDAILVGSNTVQLDDPRLDRRLRRASGPILRVVLDRRLRTSAGARLFQVPGPVLLYTESTAAAGALEAAGAEVVRLARVAPAEVLEDLHRRRVQSLLVEGGGEVLAAFAAAGRFDRVAVCCAPLLIGGRAAPGPIGGAGLGPLAAVPRLDGLRVRSRGADRILEGFRANCLRDLSQSVAA